MLFKVQKIALWSWIKYLLGGLFSLGVISNYFGYSLGNFLLCKSQAKKLLHMLSSLFFLEPILWALSKKKEKHSFQMFWIKLKQIVIHWQMVEAIVWHTTLKKWKIQKIESL